MANFRQFLAKMGKTVIFFKKALGTFFYHLQALTKCKVSEKNKPTRGVSPLPTVFLPRKLPKYRLKPPKDIALGNPKKPDKTPKNGQNRF